MTETHSVINNNDVMDLTGVGEAFLVGDGTPMIGTGYQVEYPDFGGLDAIVVVSRP